MSSSSQKYGIPLVKRTSKQPPKTGVSSGGTNASTMASAKKVIAEHRDVIRALAKR